MPNETVLSQEFGILLSPGKEYHINLRTKEVNKFRDFLVLFDSFLSCSIKLNIDVFSCLQLRSDDEIVSNTISFQLYTCD